MFIVFEGIDGCGKTSHAKKLADWLGENGVDVELTAEPTDGEIGKFIRKILAGRKKVDPKTLALLFTADRAEHIATKIEPAISAGKTVICERYTHSTIAYQSAQGVDRDWLAGINSFARVPDMVFLLDIEASDGAGRTDTREIFENPEFLSQVRIEYQRFDDVIIIDSSREPSEVEKDIRGRVRGLLD